MAKSEDPEATPFEGENPTGGARQLADNLSGYMPPEENIASMLGVFLHKVAERMTGHLRAVLRALAEHARKEYGEAVAEDLLAWANETNAETLAEWLESKGWTYLDENPEHAEKVQTAVTFIWKNCGLGETGREYVCLFEPTDGELIDAIRTGAALNENVDLVFRRFEKQDGNVVVAFPGIPRGAPLPPPPSPRKEWKDGPNEKIRQGLDGLRAIFQVREWTHLLFAFTPEEPCKWLRLLAVPWIREEAQEIAVRLQRQKTAADLDAAPRVKVKGRDFRRLPKVTAGISWAFGGPGVELSRVTVDGREYAPAPDLAVKNPSALVPASYALLPEDHAKRPHQTLLPIDLQGGQDAPPLPVAIAGATQYAIAPAAGKLGLLVMAAAHAGGGKLHKTTLRELTRAINPEASKLVTSHFDTVTRGLVQLDGLRLVLPNGLSYRVYECPVPWRELKSAEYDVPLFVGMTRTFEKTLAAIAEIAGASYRGDFLFDLTGAMLLPTRRPGLLRQYIRSCAFWNAYWMPGTAGEPDPSRVPEVSANRWAAMTNYLPPAAAEYLRAKGKGDRFRLSHSIKDTLADAETLAEAGLVKIAKASRQAVRLLPPPEYLEAWHESRKGAHRIPGNTSPT